MQYFSIIILSLVTVWAAISGDAFKFVCYYTNWAADLPAGVVRLHINDVDPSLCSHIIYAFVGVDQDRLILKPLRRDEESTDGQKGRYEQFTDLKKLNPALRTMISVGGGHAAPELFMTICRTPYARRTFASNAVSFLRSRNFDGLDIDWEYPGDPPETKELLTLLLQELRAAIENEARQSGKRKLILSLATAVGEPTISNGYDVKQVSRQVDFINLMAYDFHGKWNKITGFNSPLFSRTSDVRFSDALSQKWAVNRWLELGASKDKLVLGLSGAGITFTLQDRSQHGVGAPVKGKGNDGPIRKLEGRLTYYEICKEFDYSAVYVWDEEQSVPYAYISDQWIGFDDQRSVRAKTEWAMKIGLAGMMLWSMDYDDFEGKFCGQGKFPLLTSVRQAIDGTHEPTDNYCSMPTEKYTKAYHDPAFRVLCYFTNWSPQVPIAKVQFRVSHINPRLCTHAMFSFAKINTNNLTLLESLEGDESRKKGVRAPPLYEQLFDLKEVNPKLLTILVIGGHMQGSAGFVKAIQTPESRAKFAVNVIKFLRRNRFDGVDVDWEFPGDPEYTKEKYADLLQEIRCQFEKEARVSGRRRLLLSVATSVSEDQIVAGYDIERISSVVDSANLMAYDFMGPWNRISGFNSPLFKRKDDPRFSPELSQEWAVRRWTENGLPPEKAVLGLSAYGNTFTLADPAEHDVGSPVTGPGKKGLLREIGTHLAYFEICQKIQNGFKYEWDEKQMVPYAYKDDQWVGFDDPRSFRIKTKWALEQHLGGVLLWSLDLDDFKGEYCREGKFPLLRAIWSALENLTTTTKQPTKSPDFTLTPTSPATSTTPYETKVIVQEHDHKHETKTKVIIIRSSASSVKDTLLTFTTCLLLLCTQNLNIT